MKKILLITITILFYTTSFAQSKGAQKPYQFSLGAGLIMRDNIRYKNSYDEADKNPIRKIIPMALIKVGPLRVFGPNIILNLHNNPFFSPSIILKRAGDRYYGPDELTWRKPSWFGGISIRALFFQISYTQGLQDRSKGKRFNISVSPRMRITDKLMLITSLGVEKWNENYTNYYYGVSSGESNTTRSKYTPGSTTNTIIGVTTRYSIIEKLAVSTSFKYKMYGKEVNDSPTTISARSLTSLISIIYSL